MSIKSFLKGLIFCESSSAPDPESWLDHMDDDIDHFDQPVDPRIAKVIEEARYAYNRYGTVSRDGCDIISMIPPEPVIKYQSDEGGNKVH
jgi:hypothetical protein